MIKDTELHEQLAMTILYQAIYNPEGFTIDVKTKKVVDHGVPVGGYHGDDNPHWMVLTNNLQDDDFRLALLAIIGDDYDTIIRHGHIGGWLNDEGKLVLDIVKLHPCFTHGQSADGILEGQRLGQQAVGWLCPDLGGYKEVTLWERFSYLTQLKDTLSTLTGWQGFFMPKNLKLKETFTTGTDGIVDVVADVVDDDVIRASCAGVLLDNW